MTWWVHCNSCRALPGVDKKFYLSSCGHVLCEQCNAKCVSVGKCAACGRAQFASQLIGKALDKHHQQLFKSPHALYTDALSRVKRVVHFRGIQMSILRTQNQTLLARMQKILKEHDKLKRENERLSRQILLLTFSSQLQSTALQKIMDTCADSLRPIKQPAASNNNGLHGDVPEVSFDGLGQSAQNLTQGSLLAHAELSRSAVDDRLLSLSNTGRHDATDSSERVECSSGYGELAGARPSSGGGGGLADPSDSFGRHLAASLSQPSLHLQTPQSQLSSELTTPKMLGFSQRGSHARLRSTRNSYRNPYMLLNDSLRRGGQLPSGSTHRSDTSSGSRVTLGLARQAHGGVRPEAAPKVLSSSALVGTFKGFSPDASSLSRPEPSFSFKSSFAHR